MNDETTTKPRNFCVRQGERTLNVTRYPSGGAFVHANTDGGYAQYSASVEINAAQTKRLAAYLDPQAAALASAARDLLAAIGPTMAGLGDASPEVVEAATRLNLACAREG